MYKFDGINEIKYDAMSKLLYKSISIIIIFIEIQAICMVKFDLLAK